MKLKSTLFLIALFFSFQIYSQNEKNDVLLSVTASPFPTTNNDSKDFGMIGKVGIEFLLSNKVSLSGNFFASNNTMINNESDVTINSIGFIPSIQYYFLNKPKINVFGQIGYGFGFEDLTRNNGEIENSALTIFSVGPGINFKISEKLFVQLNLPYFKAKNITINENAADGIAVFLGFNFKF